MITVIHNNQVAVTEQATVQQGELWMSATELERVTGLQDPGTASARQSRDNLNVSELWQQAGRPIISSEQADAWVLGAGAQEAGAALESLQAPDFTLADLDGQQHTLSDYRGKKIFLTTWASW